MYAHGYIIGDSLAPVSGHVRGRLGVTVPLFLFWGFQFWFLCFLVLVFPFDFLFGPRAHASAKPAPGKRGVWAARGRVGGVACAHTRQPCEWVHTGRSTMGTHRQIDETQGVAHVEEVERLRSPRRLRERARERERERERERKKLRVSVGAGVRHHGTRAHTNERTRPST
jgi:hypothetical protein